MTKLNSIFDFVATFFDNSLTEKIHLTEYERQSLCQWNPCNIETFQEYEEDFINDENFQYEKDSVTKNCNLKALYLVNDESIYSAGFTHIVTKGDYSFVGQMEDDQPHGFGLLINSDSNYYNHDVCQGFWIEG